MSVWIVHGIGGVDPTAADVPGIRWYGTPNDFRTHIGARVLRLERSPAHTSHLTTGSAVRIHASAPDACVLSRPLQSGWRAREPRQSGSCEPRCAQRTRRVHPGTQKPQHKPTGRDGRILGSCGPRRSSLAGQHGRWSVRPGKRASACANVAKWTRYVGESGFQAGSSAQ